MCNLKHFRWWSEVCTSFSFFCPGQPASSDTGGSFLFEGARKVFRIMFVEFLKLTEAAIMGW